MSSQTSSAKLKIFILVQRLNYGGAQRQVLELSRALCTRGHDVVVAVFYAGGPLEPDLRATGATVHVLDKRNRWDLFGFFTRLISLLRSERPDILQTYLSIPNLLGITLKPFHRRMRIIWGIRSSAMASSKYEWLLALSYRLEPWLARFADLIICNSNAGKHYVDSIGFPSDKTTVIPNGIDTVRFRVDPAARQVVRTEWGIANEDYLVGIVARFDPNKDHATFLRAAVQVATSCPTARFVCIGAGTDEQQTELAGLAESLVLQERLIWAGPRGDMERVYNALDLLVSATALREGFPNVIAEAMACNVPCVVTDVGDSARIVGDTGEVVPPSDPVALARAINIMFSTRSVDENLARRRRITEHFSLDRLADRTIEAYRSLRKKG